MQIAGIDEAGKGPCIGPLVVCGLAVDEKKQLDLKMLGVRDSKKLTPLRRTVLAEKIRKLAGKIEIIKIAPEEIDKAMSSPSSNLNILEAEKISEIINRLKPGQIIIDCPSPNTKQFVRDIKKKLHIKTEIIAEHKADDNYPVVSAASIIAKVTRDNEIEKLKKEYKVDFGSGYMSDEITQGFLKNNWEDPKYSHIIRHNWESWKRLSRDKHQMRLSQW
jgi:ribonuclease HII